MDQYSIIITLSSFMEIFVLERLMAVFYEKRRTSLLKMRLSYLLVYAISVAQSLSFRHENIAVRSGIEFIACVLGYYIITLNYESTKTKRIAVTIFTFLLMLSVGIISFGIVANIFPQYSPTSDEILAFTSVGGLLLFFVIMTLLKRFKNIRKSSAFFPSVLIIPVGLLLVMFCLWYIGATYLLDAKTSGVVYSFIIGATLMAFCFMAFYLYDRLSELYDAKLAMALQAQEREYYYAQCQLMQKSVEQVKSIRHDMKNHLATIRGYSAQLQADEITGYVDALLGDIGASEGYGETGNIVFDSIINFKLQNAQKENIKLDIRHFIPPHLNIEVIDTITILGNLLDNALAAVKAADEKWITIDISYDRESLFIEVKNSFDGTICDGESRKDKPKKTATRQPTGDHGFGLKNIKQSVEKYNGKMTVDHQGTVFSVDILLYLDNVDLPRPTTNGPM